MGYIDTNKPLFDLIEAERQAEAGIAAAQLRRPNLAAATNNGRRRTHATAGVHRPNPPESRPPIPKNKSQFRRISRLQAPQ